MKCKYCRWTGPGKKWLGHVWDDHKKIAQRNSKKAHSPAAKAKAARTRAANARGEGQSTSRASKRSRRAVSGVPAGADYSRPSGTWHPDGCRCLGCRA